MDCIPGFVADSPCPDVSGIAVDVRLFHENGCGMVHKYRVHKDPFPHLGLRGGGGGVIDKLLSLVGRAMAIAQLTHLHISIPASGAVPEDCFQSVSLSRMSAESRRVSFASAITILGAELDSEVARASTSGSSDDSDS